MESAAERRAHPVLFAFRRRGRYRQYQASDDAISEFGAMPVAQLMIEMVTELSITAAKRIFGM